MLILTAFLLFCGSLSSAFANLLPQHQVYSPTLRVNTCHLVISQAEAVPCCKIKTCHQTTPQQRDLGGPEYQNQQKISYHLAHESRSFSPQLKISEALSFTYVDLTSAQFDKNISHRSLQSLSNLRSVVLRH
jgi:hypothetical protein